jgi:pimeloyl-ACP methyl ester carboxylesterase
MPQITHGRTEAPGAPPLAYSQSGSGGDVVLVHGALTTREEMMLALLPTLSERFRVTAFDRPGHGQSGRLGATGSPWRQAQALAAAARALELERPILVGHSFGGAVALAHALQFPGETAGVAAIAPIAFPEARLEHLVFGPRGLPVIGPAIDWMAGAGLDPVLLPVLWRGMFAPQEPPARFLELFPFEEAAARAHTEAEGEDANLLNLGLMRSTLNYPRCQVPVRILAGGQDRVINTALHARLLARTLPLADYRELAGLGHMLHHFAPGAVAEAVASLAGAAQAAEPAVRAG